ncbi:MAG: LLM class flavin-dependent oxidoreductase, partial [Candidatus Jordarchaeaceae archaeon]
MNDIKFGVFLPTFGQNITYQLNLKVALTAEKLGFESIWACDHLFGVYSLTEKPKDFYPDILECWTTLSALASKTSKIRLGTSVIAIPYRNPAVLAKMAATLDVISDGRLILGIGAGRSIEEFLGYGIPWEPFDVRFERTKESIEILKKLWEEQLVHYQGKHYKLVNCQLAPKP